MMERIAMFDARAAGTVERQLQERRRSVDGDDLGGGKAAGKSEGHAARAAAGVDDAVNSIGHLEQVTQPGHRLSEPRRVEVGVPCEPRARRVEVDVMRAVDVVAAHDRILLTACRGVSSATGTARVDEGPASEDSN